MKVESGNSCTFQIHLCIPACNIFEKSWDSFNFCRQISDEQHPSSVQNPLVGVIVGVRLTWLTCNSIAFLLVSFSATICGKYAWLIMLTISRRKQGDSVVITGALNYDKLCVIMNPKHVPESKIVLDSCVWFWFLGSVFKFWVVFWILGFVLDSGSVFGLWDVFWILEVFLDSGMCFGFWRCFWILGLLLDSEILFWILGCVLDS